MRKPPNELTKDLDESLEKRSSARDLPLHSPDRRVVDAIHFVAGMLRRYEREPMVVRAFLLDLRQHLNQWHDCGAGDVAEKETRRALGELGDLVKMLEQKRGN